MATIKPTNTNAIVPFTSEATPSFSKETIKIFYDQKFILPNSVISLKAKVSYLERTQKNLHSALDNSTRDKIISLLAMVLAMSIIAAGVLGTYYGVLAQNKSSAFFVGILPLATLFTTYFLTAYYNDKWRDENEEPAIRSCGYSDPIVLSIVGPYIPVYMTFGNASRYEKAAQQTAQKIQNDVNEAKQFFSQNQEPTKALLAALKGSIPEVEKSLSSVQSSAIKSPEIEKALTSKLDGLKKAQGELEAALAFFKDKSN